MSREVMQQALEALKKTMGVWGGTCAWHGDVKKAIAALKAALAETDEPVGWFESPHGAFRANPLYKMQFPSKLLSWSIPLFTHPAPQRQEQPMPPVPLATAAEQQAYVFGWWKALETTQHMHDALQIIATPQRPDGTWNRDREACRQIAAEALGFHNKVEQK